VAAAPGPPALGYQQLEVGDAEALGAVAARLRDYGAPDVTAAAVALAALGVDRPAALRDAARRAPPPPFCPSARCVKWNPPPPPRCLGRFGLGRSRVGYHHKSCRHHFPTPPTSTTRRG